MQRFQWALAVGLLVSSSGCALLQELLGSAVKRPTMEFRGASLGDISLAGLSLNLNYEVENPNALGISIAEVSYALYVEDKQVVAGAPPNGLTIPANGRAPLVFPAGIRFADLVPVVQTFLTKDTAKYRASGHIGLETPLGLIRLPLDKEGTFDVPKMPQLALENPRVSSVNLAGATIEFPFTLENKNSFPLPIGGVSGQVKVANVAVGTISSGALGLIPGGSKKRVAIPVSVSFLGAASAIISAVNGGRADVAFDAKVDAGGLTLGLPVHDVLQFIK